jgi:hypothetical protein
MRRSIILSAAILFCLALTTGLAADKPNFTGTWIMDQNASFGVPPDMVQTLTVTHTGDKITLEIKTITKQQGERTINDTYTLDGKETEFVPQTLSGPSGKGKRTAKWLPDGSAVIISEDATVDTPNGPVTTHQTRKWRLSSDRTRLTIDYYSDTPRGSFESKRIYTKK